MLRGRRGDRTYGSSRSEPARSLQPRGARSTGAARTSRWGGLAAIGSRCSPLVPPFPLRDARALIENSRREARRVKQSQMEAGETKRKVTGWGWRGGENRIFAWSKSIT